MDDGEREQLLAVYAAERQDDQSALAIAFVIATAGITYVTIGAAYLNDHCGSKGCNGGVPGWTPILAPLIPMALFGFLTINLAATRMRSVHLQRLEYVLQLPLINDQEPPTAPSFHTDAGLVYRAIDSMDRPRFTRILFIAVTLITYPIIYGTLLGFTFVALRDAAASELRTVFIYIYIIIAAIEGLAILMSLTGERFKYKGPMAGVDVAKSHHLGAPSSGTASSSTGGSAQGCSGVAADLERLVALHSSGMLDDEEFRAAKARIIGQISLRKPLLVLWFNQRYKLMRGAYSHRHEHKLQSRRPTSRRH